MITIEDLKDILSSEARRMEIIQTELLEIKEKYGDDRRSEINMVGGDFSMEDMIPNESVVLTISHAGYIKRTPLKEYKIQNRGGVGQKASTTRDEDFLEYIFSGTNHQYILFFTQKGKCFWMRVFEIPEGSKTSKGRAIQNLMNLDPDDRINAFILVENLSNEDYINNHYVLMATKKGQVKKTILEQYSRPRINGINAISIRDGDELLSAVLTDGENQVMLGLRSGKALRFEEKHIRPMGRGAAGVKGVTLASDKDEVIGMICVKNPQDETVLVVSEKGYGKRTFIDDADGEPVYRITNRGGKGVKTISISEKTGQLVAMKTVHDEDDLMIIKKSGVAIRMSVSDIRTMGRSTQGVRLISLKGDDEIAAVAKIINEDEDEIEINDDLDVTNGETTEE